MEDRKHYWEDVCIPRNEFIKEHIHLLHLLRHGDRTQLLAEAKSQEAELKGKTGGSRAAGYIKKLIAMYKEGLEVFDINKMKWASDNLKAFGISMEEDEAPVPNKQDISDIAKQNKARKDRQYLEERYIQPYKRAISNIEYYGKKENWGFLTAAEKASLYQKIYDLDYYRKQVPEVGANPYPNADSLPLVEMRRGYKTWLKKNNLKEAEDQEAELKGKTGKSFGSTVSEQVENILATIYGSYPIERQKQAVRKALEILRYKENNIIQEARKPLQAKLVKELNDIKSNPKKPRYDLFGQSPATGKPMQKSGDFTELAKEIPSFEKSVVDIVEAEIKAEQKAQKMRFKKQQEEFRKQEEERDKKDKEYASKVDIQALREQYGTGKDKKYPSDKLFKKLVDNGITNSLNYERNRGSLPHYKDFVAAFGNTFFSQLDEYIEDRR